MGPLRILVTGGAGFIGSALIRHLIAHTEHHVYNVDKLTYAGNLHSLASVGLASVGLASVGDDPRYQFLRVDICNGPALRDAFQTFRPDVVTHLAAESHVDRSIDGPGAFIQTNIVGTFVLLSEAYAYWSSLDAPGRRRFRFHHISTDEVFGSLGPEGLFSEATPYDPRSPYSASKASSDHLVRSWGHTYGLPVIVTNCSNNYGPYHFPEKLIPLMIIKGLAEEPLPVYGQGSNVRDWLFVDDHVDALVRVFEAGRPGETYVIGGRAERSNIDVVRRVCEALDRRRPRPGGERHEALVSHVADRPGHDHRYAIDPGKIERELGWRPSRSFEAGIETTVDWYLANEAWWRPLLSDRYAGQRLGLLPRERLLDVPTEVG